MKVSGKAFSIGMFFGIALLATQYNIMAIGGEMHNPKMGQLTGAGGHHAEGSVHIKSHSLVLSNISVDKVPDGRVYLTKDANYESGVELGRLTQFSGNMNYSIPDDVNPDDYNSVLIWCKKFSVEIGHANLTPTTK